MISCNFSRSLPKTTVVESTPDAQPTKDRVIVCRRRHRIGESLHLITQAVLPPHSPRSVPSTVLPDHCAQTLTCGDPCPSNASRWHGMIHWTLSCSALKPSIRRTIGATTTHACSGNPARVTPWVMIASLPCSLIGIRPNSPHQTTRVSSRRPLCLRSLSRAATGRSLLHNTCCDFDPHPCEHPSLRYPPSRPAQTALHVRPYDEPVGNVAQNPESRLSTPYIDSVSADSFEKPPPRVPRFAYERQFIRVHASR